MRANRAAAFAMIMRMFLTRSNYFADTYNIRKIRIDECCGPAICAAVEMQSLESEA